jgi:DNA polymerase, archaea type
MLIPPKEYQGSFESEMEYIKTLTERMPEGIKIGHDGRYAGAMIVDGKSYALLKYDGTLLVKGNTLRGRSMEPFNTLLIKKTISELLNGNENKCTKLYQEALAKLQSGLMNANEICTRSSLGMTIEEYLNKKEAGNSLIAEYELALKSENKLDKGDVIKSYIREKPMGHVLVRGKPVYRKLKLANYECTEFFENFDYDYDLEHYEERLNKAVKKFMILGKDTFTKIYGDIKIKNDDRKKYTKNTGRDYDTGEVVADTGIGTDDDISES